MLVCVLSFMTSRMLVMPTSSLETVHLTLKVCTVPTALSDPLSHSYIHTVRFRFVVFRPFVNEVLVGKIRSCNQEGVRGDECLIPIHITAISSCSVSGLL